MFSSPVSGAKRFVLDVAIHLPMTSGNYLFDDDISVPTQLQKLSIKRPEISCLSVFLL